MIINTPKFPKTLGEFCLFVASVLDFQDVGREKQVRGDLHVRAELEAGFKSSD